MWNYGDIMGFHGNMEKILVNSGKKRGTQKSSIHAMGGFPSWDDGQQRLLPTATRIAMCSLTELVSMSLGK